MEISEQVGMTPEIIQKVRLYFIFFYFKCITSSSISVWFSFSLIHCAPFSLCSSKTKPPSSLQKERRFVFHLATLSTISIVSCIVSQSLNGLLCFPREEKLSQRSWLELRISASTAKWPHMPYVHISVHQKLICSVTSYEKLVPLY